MKQLTILILFTFALSACKKDESNVANPVQTDESELITTLKLEITPLLNPTNVMYVVFQDLDGDGGSAPIIDTIRLGENTDYQVRVLVLNETSFPADTISLEIEEEKNDHQFFYTKFGAYDLTTTYMDFDDNGVPLGLNVSISSGAAFTTKNNVFNVVLKHQPGVKPAVGNGDILLGETDIDVMFPILIE